MRTGLSALFLSLLAAFGSSAAPTWTVHGPLGGYVSSIAIDPNDAATIFSGTSGPDWIYPHGAGVFISTDAGQSWSPVNRGLPTRHITLVRTTDDGSGRTIVYAGTWDSGLFRSDDHGLTWTAVNYGAPAADWVAELQIAPSDPQTMYLGTSSGLFITDNGGASWRLYTTGYSSGASNLVSIAIDPVDPRTAFGISWWGDGVFKTTDGGMTWAPVNCGLTPFPLRLNSLSFVGNPAVELDAAGEQGYFILPAGSTCWLPSSTLPVLPFRFAANEPSSPYNMFAASENAIFASANGGTSWSSIAPSLLTRISALAADRKTKMPLFGTTGEGFFRSFGGPLTPYNDGLTAHDIRSVAVSTSNPRVVYAAAADYGLFKTTDGGVTWNAVLSDFPVHTVTVDPTNSDIIYEATNATPYTPKRIKKSVDGGATWTFLLYPSAYVNFIYTIVVDPSNPRRVFLGTDGGLWLSTNGGGTWTGLVVYAGGGPWVWSVAIDPATPANVYATGFMSTLVSSDGGVTWVDDPRLIPTAIATRPDGRLVYAGDDHGNMYITRTGARAAWTLAANFGSSISSIVVDPKHPDIVYAATHGAGIFQSVDRGATWSPFNSGDLQPDVNSLAFAATGTFLYAGTGGSVYAIEFP